MMIVCWIDKLEVYYVYYDDQVDKVVDDLVQLMCSMYIAKSCLGEICSLRKGKYLYCLLCMLG